MKILFTTVWLSLWPLLAFGNVTTLYATLSSGGGGGGDCATGTYEAYYNGQHSNGEGYICYNSGAGNEIYTNNTADSITNGVVAFNSGNENLTFDLTGVISNMSDNGSLFFNFIQTDGGVLHDNCIGEFFSTTSNFIRIEQESVNSEIQFRYRGNAVNVDLNVQNILSYGTELRCGFSWDVTNTSMALDCVGASETVTWTSNGGSPDGENTSIALTQMTAEPVRLVLGENISGATVNDTMNVTKAVLVSGYKATDPGPQP